MTIPGSEGFDINKSLDETGSRIREGLDSLMGPASPSMVFSEPQVIGDDLVFTASSWERGGGFGLGAGTGGDPTGGGTGGGGGAGGGSQGRPVAVIRVGPGGIEVRPVLDLTKLAVTVLLAFIGVWKALKAK